MGFFSHFQYQMEMNGTEKKGVVSPFISYLKSKRKQVSFQQQQQEKMTKAMLCSWGSKYKPVIHISQVFQMVPKRQHLIIPGVCTFVFSAYAALLARE